MTGSRLARTADQTPIPVTVVGADEIAFAGATNIDQIVNDISSLGQGIDSNSSFGANSRNAGTSLLNLRGLGVTRTLVLVDGRRHVGATAGDTSVDINTIPVALIDRVEVSTGGASVAYGADGVSGVVNFILKKDFTGLQLDAQAGQTGYRDGQDYYFALTGGTSFGSGRGNATVSLSLDQKNQIDGVDRDFVTRQTMFVNNPANATAHDGIPARILMDNLRINVATYSGLLRGQTNGAQLVFNPDGTARPFNVGTDFGSSLSIGGDGLDLSSFTVIQTPAERGIAAARLNYDFTPSVHGFLDAKFAHVQAKNQHQGLVDAFAFGDGAREPFVIKPDNPFLPADPSITALFAANPEGVRFSRFTSDLGGGLRVRRSDRDTYRVVAGVSGDIDSTPFTYEAYYEYGRSDVRFTDENNRLSRNFRLAVDAVTDTLGVVPGNTPGSPACRATVDAYTANPAGGSADSVINACQPLDLFGLNRASQQAADYVMVDLHEHDRLEQQVLNATISGNLFTLPAGPVSTVAGVEWREEKSQTNPDPLQIGTAANPLGLVYYAPTQPVAGSYHVLEGFVEAAVPLIADRPFIKLLSVEGGGRLSDYSTIGRSSSWRAGVQYAPIPDIRFRGGYAVAVRAPNIGELFTPAVGGASGITDPCTVSQLTEGPNPEQRQANCADLVPTGYTDSLANISKSTLVSGNPDLTEEKAKSTTFGAVFTPRFIPGFSAAIDYFRIKIDDAVGIADPQTIVDNCVDFFPTTDNDYCDLITRKPAGDPQAGLISQVRIKQLNVASIGTRGVDFEANYHLALDTLGLGDNAGDVALRLYGTKLIGYDEQASAFSPVNEGTGELTHPKWRWNARASYLRGPLTVIWSTRFIGATEFDVQDDPVETTAPQGFAAQAYHDVQTRWAFRNGLEVYVGMNNVFDKQPPYGSRSSTTSAVSLFGQIGRFYYGGVSLRL